MRREDGTEAGVLSRKSGRESLPRLANHTTVAPTAVLEAIPNVTGPGGMDVLITVHYSDNRLVDVSSLDAADLVVTRLWDGHVMQDLTVIWKPSIDAASAAAVYRLPAPDGTWGTLDDGDYRITLAADQVWDTTYNDAKSIELGTFNIDTTPGLIRVDVTYDAPDIAPGDGLADDGTGHTTLRAAIMEANAMAGENTIRIPPGTYALTVAGVDEDASVTGDLDIADTLTMRGAGADKTVIDAAQLDRVLHVLAGETVYLQAVTMTGGAVDYGGGILNLGQLTLFGSTVSDNHSSKDGGGIYNEVGATMSMAQSTLSGNSATGYGGGLFNDGQVEIVNSTISDNSASTPEDIVLLEDFESGIPANWETTNINGVVPWGTSDQFNGIGNLTGGTGLAAFADSDFTNLDGQPYDSRLISPPLSIGEYERVELQYKAYFRDLVSANDFLDVDMSLDGGNTWELLRHYAASFTGTDLIDLPIAGGQSDVRLRFRYANLSGGWDWWAQVDDVQVVRIGGGGGGGGIANNVHGNVTLNNTTLSDNSASETGGGIYNLAAVNLHNTIVADNEAMSQRDADGTFISHGHNLVGDTSGSSGWIASDLLKVAPLLGPLQDNGGSTFTHALLHGSPAVEAGDNDGAPATDQRDIARPQDADGDGTATVDIGATERYHGEIYGVLFRDNANGVRELREPGLPDRQVYVDINNNGRLDTGEPVTVTSDDDPLTVDVDETGTYSFLNIEPGDHRIGPVLEVGWEQTLQEPQLTISRESVVPADANDISFETSISSDGRYVAFTSVADNLVPEDTNGYRDIFVHDRHTGQVERVNVASDGAQASRYSGNPRISDDGRYVAFWSRASNLVPGDTNDIDFSDGLDIFVHDRLTGSTERVSVASDGSQAEMSSYSHSISADGRYVVFQTETALVPQDTNNRADIFIHDRQTGITERVSIASNGTQANNDCHGTSISADGRYVAFESNATNLVPDDTNNRADIFVHDRQTGITERVNMGYDGTQADGSNGSFSISADGRYVAFESNSTNLVPDDTNETYDIFIHDRQTGSTERVSVATDGSEANGASRNVAISADGRCVTFQSDATNLVVGDTNGASDIFVYDRQSGITSRVSVHSNGSQGGGLSALPSISGDGRYVAFESVASNLVSGDTNQAQDTLVHDRETRTTQRVSVAPNGTQADSYCDEPSISGDGRYVAFRSWAFNLVAGDTNGASDIFVRDRQGGSMERVSVTSDGTQANGGSRAPSINADGQYVVFLSSASNLVPGDANDIDDIFVHDRHMHTTERVNVASDGTEANDESSDFDVSADGRYVVFASEASNLVLEDTNGASDIFVHDRQTGITDRVSVDSAGVQANSNSLYPCLSADGRYVAFSSIASNLVPGDTNFSRDIFVHDRQAGTTERVSVASDGSQANSYNWYSSISADGRYVTFSSDTSNLTPGDTNNARDIFVHDRQTGTTERVSVASDGTQSDQPSGDPTISDDGRYVAFKSDATNLVPADTNWSRDIFVHDRQTGSTDRISVAADGSESNEFSDFSSVSADGRYVVLSSWASNLVPEDTNASVDIFVAVNPPAWQEQTVTASLRVGGTVSGMETSIRPVPGVIRGSGFHDVDRDGFHDVGEPGLVDWTLYLDLDDNGIRDAGEPSATTDSHGEFEFTDLAPFTNYTLRQVPQEFWVQTAPRLIDGGNWTVEIGPGTVATEIDFGNYYRGPGGQDLDVIAGRLFLDPNGDGIQDADEPGLVGRTVYLDANDNGQLDIGEPRTVTVANNPNTPDVNEAGDYLFEGLSAAVYVVRAVGEVGWLQTTPMENDLTSTRFGDPQLGNSQSVATGDFDGDGDVDVVVAYGDAVALLSNDGSGAFADPVNIYQGRSGSLPYSIAVAKLDDDDDLDLAVANYFTSDVTILLNNGSGSFQQASGSPIAVGQLPGSIAAGDLDGDGDYDLAVANEFDNNVSILRNNGLAQFAPDAKRLAVGGGPKSVVIGRFYDDGEPVTSGALDLAVANYDSNNVSIWLNSGSGAFITRVQVAAGDGPAGLSVGDLDRDGDQDLVVTNLDSQNLSVLRNDGYGSFEKLSDHLAAGPGVYSLVAVDMDHDTDADLIVTNGIAEGSLHVTLLRNLSTPQQILFGPPQSYGAGTLTNWSMSFGVTAAQLNDDNGDGRVDQDDDLDLAIANGYADGVSVVLNDVAPGSHRVTLSGTEPVNRLDFGYRSPGISVSPVSGLVTSEAGAIASFTVALRTQPTADVTIEFSSSDINEGTIAPASLTFTTADWKRPQTITVTGVDDTLDDGDVVYHIVGSASVSDDSDYAGVLPPGVSLTNLDDDPKVLQVTQFTPTPTGFVVQLSQPLDTTLFNVRDDVLMVGDSTGIVYGSLVVDPSHRQVTFLQTGGLLLPDTYTVTLKSGAAALRDTAGLLLDGNADGVVTAGDDYVTTMIVDPPPANAIEVGLPDFARGYGQPVHLPADDLSAGLPLAVSDGQHVSGLDLHLHYDPNLLEISGFALHGDVQGRGSQASLSWPSAGTIILTISSPASFAADAGPLTLGAFTARVPDDAPYAAKHVLDIRDLHVYDDATDPQELPSLSDDSIHVAAFLGDTNGSGTYNAPDTTLVQRLIGQITQELVCFQQLDPRLLADITLNNAIQANDTTGIQRAIGQVPVATIPALPDGLAPPPASGLDPQIYIPQDLAGRPGETVTVPVRIQVTEASGITLSGLDLVIQFDASRFTVASAQIGSVLEGNGFAGLLSQPQTGMLIYTASSASGTSLLPYQTTGDLLTISFTVLPDAATGPSAINLRASLGHTTTALFDNDLNDLTLSPAPTNAADDTLDGILTVPVPANVVDRHVFYNDSRWDGHAGFTTGDPAANALDDNAIAPDKQALVAGQKATFANYTSYSRGINAVMVDIAGLADPAGLSVSDFEFHVGNNDNPASWPSPTLDPSLITVNVREGVGVDGSDRVTILFPDGAVKKTWLQVTVKATPATGLTTADVHYWGNAIGDCGNSTGDTAVNVADQLGARAHPHTLLTPAPIDDAYDYNRDKQVNVQDELIARSNPSTLLTDVNLIDLRGYSEGEGEAGGDAAMAGGVGPLSGTELPLAQAVARATPIVSPEFSTPESQPLPTPLFFGVTQVTGPAAMNRLALSINHLEYRETVGNLLDMPGQFANTFIAASSDSQGGALSWLWGGRDLLMQSHMSLPETVWPNTGLTQASLSDRIDLTTASSRPGHGLDVPVGLPEEAGQFDDLARHIHRAREPRVEDQWRTLDRALQEVLDEWEQF